MFKDMYKLMYLFSFMKFLEVCHNSLVKLQTRITDFAEKNLADLYTPFTE